MEDEADIREQLFHNTVRENIVSLFMILSISNLHSLIFQKSRYFL